MRAYAGDVNKEVNVKATAEFQQLLEAALGTAKVDADFVPVLAARVLRLLTVSPGMKVGLFFAALISVVSHILSGI